MPLKHLISKRGKRAPIIRFDPERAGTTLTMPRRHAATHAPLPHLFRRGGCERALICLAVNGPLTVRELGRATKIDSHKMWDIVERLKDCGLVVKRDMNGGRKYVALNRRLPIYRALTRLLWAMDQYWPAMRDGKHVARWRMPFDREMSTHRLDQIFQSPLRSRVLLFVAAVGETNLQTIYNKLGLGTVSAMLAVNHWVRQGVLRSRHFKRHRLISLDPNFLVANELHRLLAAIVSCSDEYRGMRVIVKAEMRQILQQAGPWPKSSRKGN